jgi:hypothetical protein
MKLFLRLISAFIMLVCLPYGVGKHTLAVLKANPSWREDEYTHLAILAFIALPLTFVFALALSKVVILVLYLKIFKFGILRYLIYVVGAAVVLAFVAGITGTLVQCKPLSTVWTTTARENCINTPLLYRISAIPNVATDFIMLMMPLPEVWQLHTTKRIKVGISLTFLTASM